MAAKPEDSGVLANVKQLALVGVRELMYILFF